MNSQELLLSIIIPIYNGEKYIEQTIMSVINQPYKNVEIILVNDGSKDCSGNICKEMAKKYDNIFYYEKDNAGIGATRNFGIKYANGKYVTFLDQDDVWVKEVLNADIIKILYDDIDVIGFSMLVSNENLTYCKHIRVQNKEVLGGGINAVQSSWMHHSSFFVRRELIKEYNLKYPLTRHEDEIFRHMCLYVSKKIKYIDVPLFIYRNNPGSETHRKYDIEKMFGPLLQSWDELTEWHEKNFSSDTEIIKLCKQMRYIYSIEAIEILYKNGIDKKTVSEIRDRICPKLLKEYKLLDLSERHFTRIHDYEKRHMLFWLKNRIKGIVYIIGKTAMTFSGVRNLYEKKKYPELLDKNVYIYEVNEH